jgi:hypothetical protein
MGSSVTVPIDLSFYQSPSLPFAAQECQNLIPIVSQGEGSSSRGALFTEPGLTLFATTPNNGQDQSFWGFHEFQDEFYAVDRGYLFKISSAGVVTTIGAINTGTTTERAIIDDNGDTMCIVIPGVASYFYDLTNGLVQITDSVFQTWEADAGSVTSVVEVDGYFVFSTDVRIFQSSLVISNLGQTFDALAYLEPFLKQKLIRVGKARGQLVACGAETIKFFRNVGTEPFAFLEVQGATIEKGIAFRGGWKAFDNSFFFWGSGQGEKNAAWRGVGSGSVQKISTDAVDAKWRDSTYSSNSSIAFSWDGQLIVGFYNPPTALFYNITASALKGHPVWFSSTTLTRLAAPIKVYDKIMIAGGSGSIFYFDQDGSYKLMGSTTCIFAGRYLEGQGDNLSVAEIELLAETGVAKTNWDDPIADTNPQVQLEYSKDEGRTWVVKGSRSMGKSGKYKTNIRWHRLGRFDDRAIFRFTTTTDNRQAFTGMKIRLEEGY